MKLFVSVGTDHHPFERLLRWVEAWADAHPDDAVFVQHGTSPLPASLEGAELLARDEMLERLRDCDVAVLSCGPGGVMDARSQGRLPVVVARRADLGEHVDDHQSAFAAVLGSEGLARPVEDFSSFGATLESASIDPDRFRCDPDRSPPEGVRRIPGLIDSLVRRTR